MSLLHKRMKKFFSFICALSLVNGLNSNVSTSALPFTSISDDKAIDKFCDLEINIKNLWKRQK